MAASTRIVWMDFGDDAPPNGELGLFPLPLGERARVRGVQFSEFGPPSPQPLYGAFVVKYKVATCSSFLSFRAFCGGGRNATLGVPAKRKRALLRSNLPRNSRPETNCDATGAGEQPLVGVCVDHLNFASSCWHH